MAVQQGVVQHWCMLSVAEVSIFPMQRTGHNDGPHPMQQCVLMD